MAEVPGDLSEIEAASGRKVTRIRAREPRLALDWKTLEQSPVPSRLWQIDHWLGLGATLLAGRGGVGKTLLAQTIATALALGRNFLDAIAAPKRVLFWACEDDHDELWRRQIAICEHFGVRLSDLEGKLIAEPRLGRDNTLFFAEFGAPKWTPLQTELVEQVNDYQADVTFIDNVGQTFGGKESDRHHVTAFVNGMTGIAKGRAHSTILLAHPAKQEDSEFSGSTAWENSVRMRWYMGNRLPDQKAEDAEGDENPDVRYIAKRKTNYTVKDYRKLVYSQGVFATQLEPAGFTDRYNFGQRESAAEQVILKALDRFTEVHVRTIGSPTSPDYLPKKMREMKLAEDFTPKELGGALGRLRLAGRVAEEAMSRRANRQVQYGLVRVK